MNAQSNWKPTLVAIAWVGFDQPRKLGNNETGAVAALPIWINYMRKALNGVNEMFQPVPPGVVSINVNPITGEAASDGTLSEYFYRENVPPVKEPDAPEGDTRSPGGSPSRSWPLMAP